jgi:hypothetical protein
MRRAASNKPVRDFAAILMLAAVAGAMAQIIGTIIEIGRAAGRWP